MIQRPMSDLQGMSDDKCSSPRQQEQLVMEQQLPFVWAFLESCQPTQISSSYLPRGSRDCTYFLPSSCDPEAFLNSPDPP